MATLKPFAALRPRPDLAARICELPYDVMSSEEARALAADNPLSFLHVSKPEIDLPPGTDPYAPEVYARGRDNFARLIDTGALRQERQPAFYLYRQVMGAHTQVGLVALASCEDYLRGIIKKHELTRPDKEDDRVRHIESLNAQTGPVFLACRPAPALDRIIAQGISEEPDLDFTAADGVRHTAWTIDDPANILRIEEEFARVPALYIADGHHRSAAAARVYLKRNQVDPRSTEQKRPDSAAVMGYENSGLTGSPAPGGEGRREGGSALQASPTRFATEESGKQNGSRHFLSVIFPHDQLQILPYNRVLQDLNGLSPARLLEKLDAVFVIKRIGSPRPGRKHELGLYLDGRWHTLFFRPKFAGATDPIEQLDVTLLQKYVLGPIFGIEDPRTSQRVQFVGGIRGTAELERLVNQAECACAFSMFPTAIEDLMTVADAGAIMPPKSTWFEPKLRDAMFCHLLT
jgi:uncharacterized protein (DUF1015 family)